MKIMYYAVGENPKLIDIENEIRPMQKLVGGYIETLLLDRNKSLILVCNEDGSRMELPFNREVDVYDDRGYYKNKVVGNFFVCQIENNEFCNLDKNLIPQVFVQCGK